MDRLEINPGWYAIVIKKGSPRMRDPSWSKPLFIHSVNYMVSCRRVREETGEPYGGNKNVMADDIAWQFPDYETARVRGELAVREYDEATANIEELKARRDDRVEAILKTGRPV